MEITYKRISSGQGWYHDVWQVSLDTGGEMVQIDHTTNRAEMSGLAYKISRFMGKEMVDRSEPPMGSRFRRDFVSWGS